MRCRASGALEGTCSGASGVWWGPAPQLSPQDVCCSQVYCTLETGKCLRCGSWPLAESLCIPLVLSLNRVTWGYGDLGEPCKLLCSLVPTLCTGYFPHSMVLFKVRPLWLPHLWNGERPKDAEGVMDPGCTAGAITCVGPPPP